ncbi:peptidyl-prolyl cis-trans isomerase-like [Penaeus monodon]|uniref:peptidyl-prolyl cis-trans isomerase-like n=1 Tax=Penaeus monodon TaxID=6687 RepID=UPI0018A7CAA7|nr:peptidyl-prolyl cis-trans isomerase-like [Penaeus monodon]
MQVPDVTSAGDSLTSNCGPVKPQGMQELCPAVHGKLLQWPIFPRVIPGFIVQGRRSNRHRRRRNPFMEKPFRDEFTRDLRFVSPGLVAMANAALCNAHSSSLLWANVQSWQTAHNRWQGDRNTPLQLA